MSIKLSQAGDVHIKKLTLIATHGLSIDITDVFIELDLYENILSPSMTATISIADTNNIMASLPIIGEEMLAVEFTTPETGDAFVISKVFYVDKIISKLNKFNSSIFVLHLTSINTIKDMNMKTGRSFSGYPHDISRSLFEEVMSSKWPPTKDNFRYDEASNRIKFISNMWSPFQCIGYCARNAMDASTNIHAPSFIFYEDNKQYNFVSLNTLLSKDPQLDPILFYDAAVGRSQNQTGSQRDISKDLSRVIEMNYLGGFDYIKRHLSGAWSHTVTEFNFLRKTISERKHDFYEDFNESNHTGKYPPVSNLIQYSSDLCKDSTRHVFTHKYNDVRGDLTGHIMASRPSLLASLDYMKLELTIHGRTDLKAGDTINLKVQNFAAVISENGSAPNTPNLDKIWSGRYIITSMQHRLVKNRHQIIMTVSKDATDTQLIFAEPTE